MVALAPVAVVGPGSGLDPLVVEFRSSQSAGLAAEPVWCAAALVGSGDRWRWLRGRRGRLAAVAHGPPVPFSVGSVAASPGPSGGGASAGGKLSAPLSASREDASRSGHPVGGDGGSAAAACPCPAHRTPAPALSAPMAATPLQAWSTPLI